MSLHVFDATPTISRKANDVLKSVGKVELPQFRAQLVQDTSGRSVVVEDTDVFMDKFLPAPKKSKRRKKGTKRTKKKATPKNPFAELEGADNMSEAKVVKLFTEAVTKHKLTPGLAFKRCDSRPDQWKRLKSKNAKPGDEPKLDKMKQKIDAGFYRASRAPKNGRPYWADQLVPVEFKSRKQGNVRDPFEDGDDDEDGEGDDEEEDPDAIDEDELPELVATDEDDDMPQPMFYPFEPTSYTRKATRGQLTSYADLLMAVQQRTFMFMLFIIGRRCRILRWDRAGVIVTPLIDYFENSETVCEFLRRISILDDDQLGFDPTATRLSESDAEWKTMDRLAVPLETDINSTPRVLADGELEPEDEDFEEPEEGEEDVSIPEVEDDEEVSEGEDDEEPVFDYVRKRFTKSLADPRWPRYKLEVHDGPTVRKFLVGKPAFCAHGAIGRGTRGYVAVDAATSEFVWLKDAWRASYELLEEEGLILKRINEADGIDGVPTVLYHGDVPGPSQETATAGWWESMNPPRIDHASQNPCRSLDTPRPAPSAEDAFQSGGVKRKRDGDSDSESGGDAPEQPDFRLDCPIRRHKHYRLVVREVCMPLKMFKDGKQLLQIVLDCLQTHQLVATHERTKILHRDISDDNILIFPKVETGKDGVRRLVWKGILTDWEISKPIEEPGVAARARQPERTGRWQFASVNLLNNAGLVKISDDLESLVLILIYYAVRYLRSNIPYGSDVASFLDECFDCYSIKGGLIVCGSRKESIVEDKGQLVYGNGNSAYRISFHCPLLDQVISQTLMRFCALYKVNSYDLWAVKNPSSPEEPQKPFLLGRRSTPDRRSQRLTAHQKKTLQYEADWDRHLNQPDQPLEPTDEERMLASHVSDHEWMLWAYKAVLKVEYESVWDELRRHPKGDRVPKGWVSPHSVIPVSGITPGQNVRNIMIAQASGAEEEEEE